MTDRPATDLETDMRGHREATPPLTSQNPIERDANRIIWLDPSWFDIYFFIQGCGFCKSVNESLCYSLGTRNQTNCEVAIIRKKSTLTDS